MNYQKRKIRLPKWLNRQAMADAMGQQKPNLSTWLSGKRAISDNDLDDMAAFMHAISEHAEKVADDLYKMKATEESEATPEQDSAWAQQQEEKKWTFFKKIFKKT